MDALFALAQALDGAHRERPRARWLATEALALLEEAAGRYGGSYVASLSAVKAWLAPR